MNHRKKLERRTFLQDRFEILIRRQEKGEATFNELTELDEIINRDPELREKIYRERILMEGMDDFNEPVNDAEAEKTPLVKLPWHLNLLNRLKSLMARMFISQIFHIDFKKIKLSYQINAVFEIAK